MSFQKLLDEKISGKRILFLNSIRSDIASGGNTATSTLLSALSPMCDLKIVSIAPDITKERLFSYLLKSFPASIFVVLYRHFRLICLEFFARFSPWLLFSFLLEYWRFNPDIIIFNHHSCFFYAFFSRGSTNIFVWHDVPSFKRTNSLNTSKIRDTRICVFLERFLLPYANKSLVLSFSDQKVLRRLYRAPTLVIPVLDCRERPRLQIGKSNTWLLIGNWNRPENYDGATEFFKIYSHLVSSMSANDSGQFRIAGNGAENYLQSLLRNYPQVTALKINVTPHYENMSEFSELALIAPLLEGAGIKLKTLEAWSSGIPVIGTSQAFSGLPSSIWHLGGLQQDSILKLVKLCLDWNKTQEKLSALSPVSAYAAYLKAVGVVARD